MEIAYEGGITERNFGFARFKLGAKLLFYEDKSAVCLYWDCEESAPMAKIDASRIDSKSRSELTDLCLKNDFMVTTTNLPVTL